MTDGSHPKAPRGKSIALLATMLLAGCATDPQNIEPVSRDYRPLLANDCATLMDRETATRRELDRYSDLQTNNRATDVVQTATGLFFGNWNWRIPKGDAANERTIARLRGELEAVQIARATRCAEGASAQTVRPANAGVDSPP